MLIDKLSVASQSATEHASRLAVKNKHAFITPVHLLVGILEVENSQGIQYLELASTDIRVLLDRAKSATNKQAKAKDGTQQTSINRELEAVFIEAEEVMTAHGRIHGRGGGTPARENRPEPSRLKALREMA